MKKILRIAIGLTLALGLVIGIALPGLAAPNEAVVKALPRMLRGKVVSIDEENQEFFVIQAGEQEPVTILVNSDTKYFKALIPRKAVALARHRVELKQQMELKPQKQGEHNPSAKLKLIERSRRFGEEAIFDDIAVGARAVVQAIAGEDNPLAKLVLIIEPATYTRVIGTITDISLVDKTITIAPADGSSDVILSYTEKTRFILRGTTKLEEGQSTRAVYNEKMMTKVMFVPIEVPELTD